MATQLLLNIAIAFLWMQFSDAWSTLNFLVGYLVGLGLIFLMRRFFPTAFYLKKVFALVKLAGVFILELIVSSVFVIRQVIKPRMTFEPGIFSLNTELRRDWEITLLSLLITLTPGSVALHISPDKSTLYIHVIDTVLSQDEVIRSAARFEKLIMEVGRHV